MILKNIKKRISQIKARELQKIFFYFILKLLILFLVLDIIATKNIKVVLLCPIYSNSW